MNYHEFEEAFNQKRNNKRELLELYQTAYESGTINEYKMNLFCRKIPNGQPKELDVIRLWHINCCIRWKIF